MTTSVFPCLEEWLKIRTVHIENKKKKKKKNDQKKKKKKKKKKNLKSFQFQCDILSDAM